LVPEVDCVLSMTLPGDVEELKQAAADFVDRNILPDESQICVTGEVPPKIRDALRDLGYFGLTIPAEFGGLGLSHLAYCAVLEELARAPKPVWLPVSLANGVASRMLELCATDDQKHRYLPGIATGDLVPAITVTEPDAGSDVQGLKSRARPTDGGWLISGTKHYITQGARADCLFVLARTDEAGSRSRSFTIFLVEKGSPGLNVARLQETMAGPPHEQAELVFDDCFAPDGNVLGGVGNGLRPVFQTFAEERISMAITALGAARRALDLAVDYARQRQAFGSPIGDFQAVQVQLADSATELAAARAMTYELARNLGHRAVEPAEAAMVKLYASEMAGRVADRAVQIFGGAGFMAESPVSRIYKDVRVLRISGGTSEILRTVIAKALLKETSP
jgi:acyl-CoA dehydrogenase